MDFTKLTCPVFKRYAGQVRSWQGKEEEFQKKVLVELLRRGSETEFGKAHGFADILNSNDIVSAYRKGVEMSDYEGFRSYVMKMIKGERNVLWPGFCRNFAMSSGTTGGRSKYIPITADSLVKNHYKGPQYLVGLYLQRYPESRLFSGKGLILGGSFSGHVENIAAGIEIGDLSATLIKRVNPLVNLFRTPDMKTALMENWEEKLPRLAEKSAKSNVTNLSGVPSWMLGVIKEVLKIRKVETLAEVWPHLEVFFHGGISFEPYRREYERLTAGLDMHWSESYNASEGFFSVDDCSGEKGMILLADAGVYFEFKPLGSDEVTDVSGVEAGKVYELIISSCNGLWRYRIGDTVRVESLAPVRISVVGRTKSFINAFGEELMEENAEKAVAKACLQTGASVKNYTAAPVFATENTKGRHQWIVEWSVPPESEERFAEVLDEELRKVNSDYDAKRYKDIFLDLPEIVTAPTGLFDRWLSESGSGKLGGQRKIPRLNNTREVADRLLAMI